MTGDNSMKRLGLKIGSLPIDHNQRKNIVAMTSEIFRQFLQDAVDRKLQNDFILDSVLFDEAHHAHGRDPMAKCCYLLSTSFEKHKNRDVREGLFLSKKFRVLGLSASQRTTKDGDMRKVDSLIRKLSCTLITPQEFKSSSDGKSSRVTSFKMLRFASDSWQDKRVEFHRLVFEHAHQRIRNSLSKCEDLKHFSINKRTDEVLLNARTSVQSAINENTEGPHNDNRESRSQDVTRLLYNLSSITEVLPQIITNLGLISAVDCFAEATLLFGKGTEKFFLSNMVSGTLCTASPLMYHSLYVVAKAVTQPDDGIDSTSNLYPTEIIRDLALCVCLSTCEVLLCIADLFGVKACDSVVQSLRSHFESVVLNDDHEHGRLLNDLKQLAEGKSLEQLVQHLDIKNWCPFKLCTFISRICSEFISTVSVQSFYKQALGVDLDPNADSLIIPSDDIVMENNAHFNLNQPGVTKFKSVDSLHESDKAQLVSAKARTLLRFISDIFPQSLVVKSINFGLQSLQEDLSKPGEGLRARIFCETPYYAKSISKLLRVLQILVELLDKGKSVERTDSLGKIKVNDIAVIVIYMSDSY
jgi:hypothetical protein